MLNFIMIPTKSKIVAKTPKGPLTGSNPINGFQIVSIREFNSNPNISASARYRPHQLHFDLIIVFTHSSGVHNVDFINYEYRPGSIFIIKKDQCHHWYPNPNKDGYLLFFTEGFERSFTQNFSSTILSSRKLNLPNPSFNIEDEVKRRSYFDLLKLIEQEGKAEEPKVLPYLLSGFILKLELDYMSIHFSLKNSKNLILFQKFQSLLNNEVRSSRNGSYYVKKLNTTFSQLNKICKSFSSYTLKEYIDHFIVTQAKIRMNNDIHNISEIAFDLGFQEVGNFSKFFKKRTGLKPKEYRRNLLEV